MYKEKHFITQAVLLIFVLLNRDVVKPAGSYKLITNHCWRIEPNDLLLTHLLEPHTCNMH